jgi:hypothetical protein
MMNCEQQSVYDYAQSLLPFTTSDACYSLHLGPGMCDSGTWNASSHDLYVSYPIDWFLQDLADPAAYALNVASRTADFADGMNWWHIPTPLGIGIDATSQWIGDANDNYSFWQRIARAGVVAGEGQVISAYSSFAAGTDGVVGTVTGPADIIIIGGTYLTTNAAGSYMADQFNASMVFPWIDRHIP